MNSFTSMNLLYDEFIVKKCLAEAEGEFEVVYFLMPFQTVTR